MNRDELLKIAKPMIVNLQVAKTIENKFQTRRILKLSIAEKATLDELYKNVNAFEIMSMETSFIKQKWKVGDILWVREPARVYYCNRDYMKIRCEYISDKNTIQLDIPSRFCKQTKDGWLPNWMRRKKGIPNGCIKEMARHFKRVTGVRVELLQDITFGDIIKEGYPHEVLLHDKILKQKAVTTENKHEKDILNWWISTWDKTAKTPYKWTNNPYILVNDLERVTYDK